MYTVQSVRTDEGSHEAFVLCDGCGFRVTMHDVESLGITAGSVIDEETLSLLTEANERLQCIKKAFEHLSYGDLSQKQLRDKLERKFSREMSADVAALMSERGYVNDALLAERYAETFYVFKGFGLNKIKNELYKRGIGREDIENAVARYCDESQSERLMEFAKKKYDLSRINERAYRNKVYSGLMRAGFSGSEITDALSGYEGD